MKTLLRTIFGIVFIVMGHVGWLKAQMVQYGRVVEMNSKGKTISGVSIALPTAHDCQPTPSDVHGNFRLSFGEHQVGDVVYGLIIRKQGYEVVNHHIVREGWTLTDKDSLKVVMAPIGKIAEARAHYYNILETACVMRYDTTMAFLNEQYAHQLISEPEYQYWKFEAEEELKKAYLSLYDYADKLAHINEDDMEERPRLIIEKYSLGDMRGVLSRVENGTHEPVMQAYLNFTRLYPLENDEVEVANAVSDTFHFPDTLYSDIMVLQTYTQLFEGDFVINGLRYAKSCLYLGVLYKNMDWKEAARTYLTKALRMYEMLNELKKSNYSEQISRIKNLIDKNNRR